jgi:hypothetical protein
MHLQCGHRIHLGRTTAGEKGHADTGAGRVCSVSCHRVEAGVTSPQSVEGPAGPARSGRAFLALRRQPPDQIQHLHIRPRTATRRRHAEPVQFGGYLPAAGEPARPDVIDQRLEIPGTGVGLRRAGPGAGIAKSLGKENPADWSGGGRAWD